MENLYERLDILEQAGLITPFVSEQAKKIVELITECGSPMDEEKMAMFTTHIAMAIQRILNGDVENPLEGRFNYNFWDLGKMDILDLTNRRILFLYKQEKLSWQTAP